MSSKLNLATMPMTNLISTDVITLRGGLFHLSAVVWSDFDFLFLPIEDVFEDDADDIGEVDLWSDFICSE